MSQRPTKEGIAEGVTNPTEMLAQLSEQFNVIYSAAYYDLIPDNVFHSRYSYPGALPNTWVIENTVLAKYWNISYERPSGDNYIGLPTPSTTHTFTAYTKRAFSYPWGGVRPDSLPNIDTYRGSLWLYGYEPGSGLKWGLTGWVLTWSGSAASGLYARAGDTVRNMNAYLPTDYDQAGSNHTYQIKLNRNTVEYYINQVPVAYAIKTPTVRGNTFTAIAGPPYEIFQTIHPDTTVTPAFMEIEGTLSRINLDPRFFRVLNGDPTPPRVFNLYQTATTTLFVGSVIAAGTLTSHPVPVFGYPSKKLSFMASEQGTLSVESMSQSGNWREYDTIGITQDTLKTYSIEEDVVLIRVVYTPNTYPCTISEAEVVLR